MASGGPFVIVTNTGVQDKLLTAYNLLKARINAIIINKDPSYTEQDLLSLPEGGYLNINENVLPSLNEIEKTHNVFVNSVYKPHIPLAFEYIKVGYSAPKFGQKIEYMLPQVGNFINDMALHIRIKGLKAKDPRDRVRYVAFLGHRLLENVQFTVNSQNIIDEYTTDDYNSYYQHEVLPEKKVGWLRGVGQEIPNLGYITSDPLFDMHREYRWIGNGNQTLKYSHDSIDLFVPLLFWFKNIKNAIPSHIIPWGQTQIQVKLADISDIVGFADYGGGGAYYEPTIELCDLYINNIFTVPEIYELYAKKYTFSLIRVHRHHKEQITSNAEHTYEALLNNLKWPTESLYFSFRPRNNLNFSQYWYKNCQLIEKSIKVPVVAKNSNASVLGSVVSAEGSPASAILSSVALSNIDNTYNGYDFIITGGVGYNSDDILMNRYTIKSYDGVTKKITLTGDWNGPTPTNGTTFELFTQQLAINLVTYYEEHPVVDNIGLKINGIDIFKSNSEAFYNSYVSQRYGTNLCTPEDRGSYMMNFCAYPGNHNPSGTINFSLCREIYLNFTSTIISKDYPVDLIALTRAINFLFVSNGTMQLKYAT
jgi:Large eukaryotic DNA virus major capsid protein/Major capsid protein N-terminus